MYILYYIFYTYIFHFFISVRPSLEPGWLEGCLDGKRGLVPENYVEFLNQVGVASTPCLSHAPILQREFKKKNQVNETTTVRKNKNKLFSLEERNKEEKTIILNTESPVLPQIWHFSPKNLPISFQMNHCDTSQIEFV